MVCVWLLCGFGDRLVWLGVCVVYGSCGASFACMAQCIFNLFCNFLSFGFQCCRLDEMKKREGKRESE